MHLLCTLSQENLDLAVAEILALYKPRIYTQSSNFLLFQTNKKDLYKRLAYTNEVYQVLITSTYKSFPPAVSKFRWSKHYNKSFCVRSFTKDVNEKEIAGNIWRALKHPVVDLTNPQTFFGIFSSKQQLIIGKRLWTNEKEFLKRKAHLKPALHPSSLHPKLARAMINLTGKTKGTIVDPFCGSGGILIEALFLGFDVIGTDLDPIMIQRAQTNINYYNFKRNRYQLSCKDALTFQKKCSAIVTDLPYGKNTKSTDIEQLYELFLKHSASLTNTMVVGFPDFINVEKRVKKIKTKWKIKHAFTYYLHKSLSKMIYVFEQK